MHPLSKGALGVAVLALLGAPPRLYEPAPAGVVMPAASASASTVLLEPWRCPPRTLPVAAGEGQPTCLSLPGPGSRLEARTRRLAELPPSPAFLKMTAPTETIPRLPDRPEHYGDYQLPVDPVISVGTDVGPAAPGERPRLGVRMVTEPGRPVTLIDLEGETSRPEVVLVGELYGITVVVRHRVESSGPEGSREYLVFYGHLARPGPSVTSGALLSPMSVIGYVRGGEAGDDVDEEPSVYFEVRQELQSLAGPAEHLTELVQKSVAVDPRNVLPLIPKP